MKILVVSQELIGSALCHRLIREGHDVRLYIGDANSKICLDGIVEKTPDWTRSLEWVGRQGLIIFDDVGFGHAQDELRIAGYRVVGGTAASDRLELERSHFQKLLASRGLAVLPSIDFPDADQAKRFVEANPDFWVLKQNTHHGELNLVGEVADGADVIQVLERYRPLGLPIHLQKRALGVEVAVGRFFNGKGPIGPVCVNHEHKRLCAGDVGPLTPEMGTVAWFPKVAPQLYEQTLKPLEPYLIEIGYKGYFDINCIVSDQEIWPLEATARFGTPISEVQIEMLESSLADLLSALADGEEYTPRFSTGYGLAVSLALPPFPFAKHVHEQVFDASAGTRLFFHETIGKEELKHIHFEEVALIRRGDDPEPRLLCTGPTGWVLQVTGKGQSIPRAQEKAYGLLSRITLPFGFFRNDIGDRVYRSDLPILRANGWLGSSKQPRSLRRRRFRKDRNMLGVDLHLK